MTDPNIFIPINLHIHPGEFTHQSRILKETRSLTSHNIVEQIIVATPPSNGLPSEEIIDERRKIRRFKSPYFSRDNLLSKLLSYLGWQLQVFSSFYNQPVRCVNTHALSVLPVGVLFRIFKKAYLIYDAHELETETLDMAGIRQTLARMTERALIHRADVVFVVNDSIGDWYRSKYSLDNVYVIKNVPNKPPIYPTHSLALKKEMGLKEEDILFLFQGHFRSSRNIGLLLDIFARLATQRHILFLGFGEMLEQVKEYSRTYPNIHYHDPVSLEEVLQFSSGADVGICFFENTCKNNYYALPNKVYEYIMSGLPLIVNDYPEMGRVADEGQCGWKVGDNETLISLVQSISMEEIITRRKNAEQYRQTLGWENEERVLLQAFEQLRTIKR